MLLNLLNQCVHFTNVAIQLVEPCLLGLVGEANVRWLQTALEIEAFAPTRFGCSIQIVEKGKQLIEVPLSDRIILVIVTCGTLYRQSHECGAHRRDAVDHVARKALLRQRGSTIDDQVQPIETRCNQLVASRDPDKDRPLSW